MNKISINLVTWNGERYIENCLNSVLAQSFKDFSVIIIDNGSSDRTVEIINERFPQFKVITQRNNLGFAKAHNQAIHWTNSEYILCLNQDVVLDPGYLENIVRILDSKPMAGAATGKILRLQEQEMTKYIDSVGLKIFRNYRVVEIGAGEMDEGQYDTTDEIFGVSGALPVYRRKALEEVKFQNEYFDESFFSYKEDVDLASRLRYAGWSAWIVPEAVAYHDRSVAGVQEKLGKMKIARNWRNKSSFAKFYSYRNHLYFLMKNLPNYSLHFFWPVFWYELSKFLFVLVLETRNLRAWSDLSRNKKQLRQKRDLIMRTRKINDAEIEKWLN